MKVKSESEVAQSCLTLSDPMDSSLPGSSIHGIFQARVLEWGAIAFLEFFFFLVASILLLKSIANFFFLFCHFSAASQSIALKLLYKVLMHVSTYF